MGKRRNLEVVADGFAYLEGPRWHNGTLWFADFFMQGCNASELAARSGRYRMWGSSRPVLARCLMVA